MTKVRQVSVAFSCWLFCSCSLATGKCEITQRISDEDALRIAKVEMGKRVESFDSLNYNFVVKEDVCDLRVSIEKKDERKTGRHSVLVMDRSGKIKRYFGGM